MTRHGERGFTLVELLAVCSLTIILLGLGASAARHYWLVRSLDGAKSTLVSEMRAQQQKASAKSYPFAEGVWFVPGSSVWGTLEYNLKTAACTNTSERTFDSGVKASAATFTVVSPATGSCRGVVANPAAEIVLFYPAGTAIAGSVSLSHPQLSSTAKTITVSALTGRVTE